MIILENVPKKSKNWRCFCEISWPSSRCCWCVYTFYLQKMGGNKFWTFYALCDPERWKVKLPNPTRWKRSGILIILRFRRHSLGPRGEYPVRHVDLLDVLSNVVYLQGYEPMCNVHVRFVCGHQDIIQRIQKSALLQIVFSKSWWQYHKPILSTVFAKTRSTHVPTNWVLRLCGSGGAKKACQLLLQNQVLRLGKVVTPSTAMGFLTFCLVLFPVLGGDFFAGKVSEHAWCGVWPLVFCKFRFGWVWRWSRFRMTALQNLSNLLLLHNSNHNLPGLFPPSKSTH